MQSDHSHTDRLELVAIGPGSEDFWRRILPENREVRLGRAPKNGWSVPWDRWISREQANIILQNRQVQITCLETATNKISWQGELCTACTLQHGDEFQIGQTRFVIGPSAESVQAKATAMAEEEPSIDEIVQQPPRQRLERLLDMLSDDARKPPPNPQAIGVPQSAHSQPSANVPQAEPQSDAPQPPFAKAPQPEPHSAAPQPPFAKAPQAEPQSDVPQPGPQSDAHDLRAELERQQQRQEEITEEAERLQRQKNERSIEARFLREEVAQLRSKLRKKSQTAKQPDEVIRKAQQTPDTPEDDSSSSNRRSEQAADVAALQDEIQNLQNLLSKQMKALEDSEQRIGANTQLDITRASLEAERKARERSQEEVEKLRDEIAALQGHMQEVKEGKSPKPEKEKDKALETHLGLTAVEADDVDENENESSGGATFRGYELLNQIYNGGTGQVLKAKHQVMNRMVAIKLLSEENQSSIMIGRFARKVQILAYLNHPNLVSAFDAGQEAGVHYLITEYIPGRSMIRLLKRIKQLDIAHAIHFITQTCNALEYVHKRRIFHRNINPSHLLVTPEKSVKIVGWGSALFAGDEKLKEFEFKGVLVGTPDYMAPEQIDDPGNVDQRADIYSLGCTLYSIMTKRVVYPVDWTRRKLIAQRHQPAPNLKALRPDAPNLLEHIFQKMVAKDPAERFQSMTEVRDALHAVVQLPKDD